MRLPFCGCGHPLWSEVSIERGFCEHCRRHHSTHWPEFGYHPRVLPEFRPKYENPHWDDGTPPDPDPRFFHLTREDSSTVIHRWDCFLLGGNQVPWQWANTVSHGEIMWAAAYFGYGTCKECVPLVSYESTVV